VNCKCKISANRKVLELPADLQPRLLAGLSPSELHIVLSEATHRRIAENSVIIHGDEPAQRMYLLTSGQGKQFVLTREGRRTLVHWLTAGQVFGGAAMMSSPSNYLASTEVHKGGCALAWERDTVRKIITRIPMLIDNAFSIAVTENVASLISAKVSLSTDDAQARVVHLLLSLACGIGKPGQDGVEILAGNEDLASGANVTLFTISRILSKWQREGILRKRRGRVILLRPELLAGE
jgi:CRP-like cAMP-binding protein